VTTSCKEEERAKELRNLGQRAVACEDWEWMLGMVDTDGWRILRGEDESTGASLVNASGEMMHDRSLSLAVLPDLTDPATLGCLLSLVEKRLEHPRGPMAIVPVNLWVAHPAWRVFAGFKYGSGIVVATEESYEAALVQALEVPLEWK